MAFSDPSAGKAYVKRKQLLASIKIISGCVDCGVWGPAEILSFDHVTGEKDFNIGSRWDVSMARMEAEVAKCEVVCHNCHALRAKKRIIEDKGPTFEPYPKTARWFRDVTVSEKIDGTNGVIWIDGDNDVYAGSKNRWLTPEDDNAGFARWASENATHLVDTLGQGAHRGEWWGAGIQRRYGMDRKVFSLFNTAKWGDVLSVDPDPAGLAVVPVLYDGPMLDASISVILEGLAVSGSHAAPGFMDPEGVCVYHSGSRTVFKALIDNDHQPKSAVVESYWAAWRRRWMVGV